MRKLTLDCQPRIFVIAPAYNEATCIRDFVAGLEAVYTTSLRKSGYRLDLIVIDDGSSDGTYGVLAAESGTPRDGMAVTGVQLSRNFGQQAAIQAGLEYAFSQAPSHSFFVVMDSDLQHPPKLIPWILQHLEQGIDQVQMIRNEPESIPFFKKTASQAFYYVLRVLSGMPLRPGSADFRGMSYRCVQAYLQLKERGRFNRGLFHWVGFTRCEIVYDAADRKSGETKYSLRKMLSLALVGLVQFSSRPLLLICSAVMLLSFSLCLLYIAFEAVQFFRGATFVVGWASLMFLICFWSGALALTQLVTAVYIGRIFDEIKNRPIYIINQRTDSKDEPPSI